MQHHYSQVVRDNLPSHDNKMDVGNAQFGRGVNSEFVTVKVQGFHVTCVHLPSNRVEEQGRIQGLKRIWAQLEKRNSWIEDGGRHIFAGSFNSLTWEDEVEGGWARVATERAETNMKLDEAIFLTKKRQQAKDSNTPESKQELVKITARLESSLKCLGIEDWGSTSKLKRYLEFRKLEKPSFDLTKMMKNRGFRDSWDEVGPMGRWTNGNGRAGSQATCKWECFQKKRPM